MRVINECRVDFQYKISPLGPIIAETIFSNRVETDVIKKILKVEKEVDKECTYSFDILTYTISIINVGDDVVTQVFVQDDIPKGTRFIENSVMINNKKRRKINPQYGFSVGNIKIGEEKIIKFKVLVLPQCEEGDKNDKIKNYSTIEYDHLYNIEKPKERININSNEVDTLVENRVFNQITVSNEIHACNFIEDVVNTKVTVGIVDIKIINTPINKSIENLCTESEVNTCVALVIGSIEYEITYRSLNRINSKSQSKNKNIIREYCEEDIFGFSCCLLVPVGITYGDKYDINFNIEGSSTSIISPNILYLSTNILFYY